MFSVHARLVRGWAVVLGAAAVLAVIPSSYGQDGDLPQKTFNRLKANSQQAIQNGRLQAVETRVSADCVEKIQVYAPSANVAAGGTAQADAISGVQLHPPAAPPVPIGLAAKIWGQKLDDAGQPGEFINLTKHKWQRKERFYLWLDVAVPVQLAVFQNYPATQGQLSSKQVSPDERYPETLATIVPGKPFRFPVMFEMDDNLIDEVVSFVMVRADASQLPINGGPPVAATAQATARVLIDVQGLSPAVNVVTMNQALATTGTQVVNTPAAPVNVPQPAVRPVGPQPTAPATAPAPATPPAATAASAAATASSRINEPNGILKSKVIADTSAIMAEVNKEVRHAAKRKGGGMAKMSIVPQLTPVATSQSEVETLIMGPGKVGQIELTFHKD